MKIIAIFVVLICFTYIHPSGLSEYPQDVLCESKNITNNASIGCTAFSLDYCRTLLLSENTYRCCYAKAKINDLWYRGCVPISYTTYTNDAIEDQVISMINGTYDKLKIDCNSNYLTASAFVLLLSLLF